jgi:hypothetical protein
MAGASKFLGGPIGKAIKWGGGALISGLMSKRAQDAAKQYSPEELAAIANSNRIAQQASDLAASAVGESKPWLRQAGNYYSTLLSGNRAAQSQAVAPGYAAATDVYRGAQRNLDQQGIRGAARDVASADLNRQRASQLAGLVTGVQPAAAGALSKLGIEGMQSAAPLLSTSGNIYGNILGRGMQNRQWATQQGTEAGSAWGQLFRDMMEDFGGSKKT